MSATARQRRLGSIDRLMLSSFEPVLGEGGPDVPLLGIPYQDSWVHAFVRTRQDEFYWIVRGDRLREPQNEFMAVFSSSLQDGNHMAVSRELSPADFTLDPTQGQKLVGHGGKGEAHFTDKSCRWQQDGLLELTGKIAGRGLQAVLPTRRREGEGALQIYYNKQYLVTGTVRGEPVSGFMLLEHNYDTVGWLSSTWASGTGGYLLFGNEFDDDSVELGYLYSGSDLEGAIVYDAQQDLISRRMELTPTVTETGILTHATYALETGESLQFEMHPHGKAAVKRAFIPGVTSAMSFGYASRIGETRKRVRGWAVANVGRTY